MKTRLLFLLKLFLAYLAVFLLAKAVFVLYNLLYTSTDISLDIPSFLQVLAHGLPLDASTSGYLVALPWLYILISVFKPNVLKTHLVLNSYFILTAILLSIIIVVDCGLYPFWGFKLDATIFNYIDSPKDALSSVSILFIVTGICCIFAFAFMAAKFLIKSTNFIFKAEAIKKNSLKLSYSFLLLIVGGFLFLCIRGGVGKSTMNIGSVYFSENQFLNHSAVNPAFSLLASSFKSQKFDKQYQFFSPTEVDSIFSETHFNTQSIHEDTILTTERPNILLIIMEGFAGTFIESLGGIQNVTPKFHQLEKEGLFFTQMYANSFRTDRGTLCILSGYPSFPCISPMKIPEKSRSLGSIASSLVQQGYTTDFLYGGDINFTNMKSYLLSNGYQKVEGDTYFPSSTHSKLSWGITDAIAFDTLYQQVIRHKDKKPWFTTFLTLSSHEPWEVPFQRKGLDKIANSMAYLDDCLGTFINKLKKTPAWNNLLIICVADHGIGYPEGLSESSSRRYHIPMLWIGGAVKRQMNIEKICCQTDIPATLLGSLNISHNEYPFSRDVFSNTYTYPSAMHTFNNGIAFIDTTGYTVLDLSSNQILTDYPHPSQNRLKRGKAILQKNMEDFAKR